MTEALKKHWPEYLMEGAGLALFMMSACAFGALLEHPASRVHQVLPDSLSRRALMGMAMALTSIGIVYSPWGRRTGAHLNPSVTLTFLRLGKIDWRDAVFYVMAQFAGSVAGVLVARAVIEEFVSHPMVNYVATLPGDRGPAVAFVAEVVIAFILMFVILNVSNTRRLARLTGIFAGALVAAYISFEAPLSGMSLNPARTFGSAFSARAWMGLWIYFTAPPLGMLLASELYIRLKGKREIYCAKIYHDTSAKCIFRCRYGEMIDYVETHNAQTSRFHKGDSIMQGRKLILIAIAFLAAAQLSQPALAGKHRNGKEVRFTVRIENVSSKDGQVASNGTRWPFALSPGMWVIHNNDVRLFNEGKPASANGLEAQAEDGNPDVLVRTLEAYHSAMLHGLFNTPVGKMGPGPIGPGDAYEFSFSASAGMKLNLMLMFGQSNDWFYAPDGGGIALFDKGGRPVGGDVTSRLLLWDAGTEVDQEPGLGADQAPRQKAPNTGAFERDVVRKAKSSTFYPMTDRLFRITLTPQM